MKLYTKFTSWVYKCCLYAWPLPEATLTTVVMKICTACGQPAINDGAWNSAWAGFKICLYLFHMCYHLRPHEVNFCTYIIGYIGFLNFFFFAWLAACTVWRVLDFPYIHQLICVTWKMEFIKSTLNKIRPSSLQHSNLPKKWAHTL